MNQITEIRKLFKKCKVSEIVRLSDLSRSTIVDALKPKANPTIKTVNALNKAAARLKAEAAKKKADRRRAVEGAKA